MVQLIIAKTKASIAWVNDHRLKFIIWLVAGLIIATTLLLTIRHFASSDPQTADNCPSQPNFTPILPNNKTIQQLGGWKPLCPPDGSVSYVYQDKIDDANISVTLQPLPQSLTNDTEHQLQTLADNSHYTTRLEADDGTIVHIGTSAKGPQSAMMVKQSLLVFFKTDKTVSDESWRQYIQSLS